MRAMPLVQVPKLERLGPARPEAVTIRCRDVTLISMLSGAGIDLANSATSEIRTQEINGMLRFWWRATCGAADLAELRSRESELFGASDIPGRISIRIDITTAPSLPTPIVQYAFQTRNGELIYNAGGRARIDEQWEAPSYASFPFAPRQPNIRSTDLPARQAQLLNRANRAIVAFPTKCVFQLAVSCPKEAEAEVTRALRAWLNFGGLGRRTRRGFGALYCEDLAPKNANNALDWFRSLVPHAAAHRSPKGWPSLVDVPLLRSATSAMNAWQQAIDAMRCFRQFDEAGSVGRLRMLGRSQWPEADSMRHLLGQAHHRHAVPSTLASHELPAFPRAALGLPITILFNTIKAPGDPEPVEIVPKSSSRMASPFVLRAIRFADGTYAALALRLSTPGLAGVKIKAKQLSNEQIFDARCLRRQRWGSSWTRNPMGSNPCAESAFWQYLRNRGFR